MFIFQTHKIVSYCYLFKIFFNKFIYFLVSVLNRTITFAQIKLNLLF